MPRFGRRNTRRRGWLAAMTARDLQERALAFECEGQRLVGVLSVSSTVGDVAVLVIVGGPQYRAGSHRQFVLLARALAVSGVPVLRFDVRGMGDSTGPMQSFEASVPDIARALDALGGECPVVRRVVLWGLCDAASAALLYWNATKDPRVAGMVLVNPWIRSPATHAKAQLRHYYRGRLLDRRFWAKLVRLDVDVLGAARSIANNVATAKGLAGASEGPAFQVLMAEGLRRFDRPVLLLASGRDLTAREFLDHATTNPHWRGLLDRPNVTRYDVAEADHTFSTAWSRDRAETHTLNWLQTHLQPKFS